MLIGAHAILYSKNAEADRAFLRDVLRLSNVDAGGGWLIFALPTAEVAIHPADNDARRSSVARIDSAVAVHMNGLGCWL